MFTNLVSQNRFLAHASIETQLSDRSAAVFHKTNFTTNFVFHNSLKIHAPGLSMERVKCSQKRGVPCKVPTVKRNPLW